MDFTEATQSGREKVLFEDVGGLPCSVEQSSGLIHEVGDQSGQYLWLGLSEHEMHLDREHVIELVQRLTTWLETGRLCG